MKMTEFDKMGEPMSLKSISATIEGQVYKIGLTGRVLVKRNGDWVTTKNVASSDVQAFADLEERNARKASADTSKELTPYMIKKLGIEGRKERGK